MTTVGAGLSQVNKVTGTQVQNFTEKNTQKAGKISFNRLDKTYLNIFGISISLGKGKNISLNVELMALEFQIINNYNCAKKIINSILMVFKKIKKRKNARGLRNHHRAK